MAEYTRKLPDLWNYLGYFRRWIKIVNSIARNFGSIWIMFYISSFIGKYDRFLGLGRAWKNIFSVDLTM